MNKKKKTENTRGGFAISYPKGKQWKNLARRVPFLRMKEKVLGKRYDLSVAFVSPKKIQELNRRFRKKNSSTDILSFGLSPSFGELYLSMPDVAKKAKLFGMTTRNYLGYLFIHGCLHLEGLDHGRTMEVLERKFARAFHFSTPS